MAEFPAWGIHISAASVRAVKLVEEDGGLRVTAHDVIEFTDHVEEIQSLDRVTAVRDALSEFKRRHDLADCRVIVSVDGVTAFNRFVEAPVASAEGLAKILEYEAKQQIPFDLAQVYWDYKVARVREADGFADVLIFAVKKEIVDLRQAKLTEIGIPVDAFQLAPVALYNFAASEGLTKKGTAIVSVDYDRTDIVIADDERPWFRTLPDGVSAMLREIHNELQPRHRLAIKMLRGEVECPDPAKLAEIQERFTDRLSSEIARIVRYYSGARAETAVRQIVLLTGTPYAPALVPPIRKATGLEVKEVRDFRKLKIDQSIVTPDIAEGTGPLAHAVGLALQGLGRAEIAPRVCSPSVVHVITGRRFLYVACVMVVFMLVGAMWWEAGKNAGRLETARAQADDAVGRAERSIQAFKASSVEENLRDAAQTFAEVARHRTVATGAADAVITFLDGIGNTKGPDDRYYLVALQTQTPSGPDRAPTARRAVEMMLAQVFTDSPEAAAERFKKDIVQGMKTAPGVMDVKLESSFVSPIPSPVPAPLPEGRPVRRKFLVAKFSLMFEEGAGS